MASSVMVPSTVRGRGPARLSGTVLVADDEEGIRSLFVDMFRGERVNGSPARATKRWPW